MSREQYDQLWKQAWGDTQSYGPVHRHQRKSLMRLISNLNVHSVLDVGCGAGDNLAALASALPNLKLCGTDVSPQALAIAAQRLPAVPLFELDVQEGKLNQHFELVMAVQVIEHLTDDEAALRNMAAMATQWVLVTTMGGRMRRSELAIGHLRNYSHDDLRRKALRANLEVVKLFGWGFPFYSPIYRTLVEWLPGGPPQGKMGERHKAAAKLLYFIYGFNLPNRGDVLTMLARPANSTRSN